MLPAAILTAVAAMTGCTGVSPGSEEAGQVAVAFHSAASASEFHRACAMLTPPALEKLEDGEAGACAGKLAEAGIGEAGNVVSSKAYGRNAQVAMTGDTVFLTRSGGQWKIMGAGCAFRAERPYACEVEGD